MTHNEALEIVLRLARGWMDSDEAEGMTIPKQSEAIEMLEKEIYEEEVYKNEKE